MLFACPQPSASWLAYVGPIMSAFVALMIGAGGLWIAHWQMRVAREKLRTDLYDRRYAIFEAFRELLNQTIVPTDAQSALEAIRRASVALSAAPFLLDVELVDYLRPLYGSAFKQIKQAEIFPSLGQQLPRSEWMILYDKWLAALGPLETALSELADRFMDSLRMNDFTPAKLRLHKRIGRGKKEVPPTAE